MPEIGTSGSEGGPAVNPRAYPTAPRSLLRGTRFGRVATIGPHRAVAP
jgi:hypothetical protein